MMKFIVYTNETITALSNNDGIITCINGVWPNLNNRYIGMIKASCTSTSAG